MKTLRRSVLLAPLVLLWPLGCGGESREAPPARGDGQGGGTGGVAGPGGTDPIEVAPGVRVVPDRAGLQALVRSRAHEAWSHEAAPHPSTGPHGDVQMYFNEPYRAARLGERYPMPRGAMSVKALFAGGQLDGYAVGLKILDGDGPQTWLWWEATGDLEGGYYGVAQPVCEGCHRRSARDRSLVATVP